MRTLLRNKQTEYYANPNGTLPIYERNSDGTIKYITVDGKQIPKKTGDTEVTYDFPTEFDANIAFSGGEVQSVEFGVDRSAYDATIVVDKGALRMTENALVWYQSAIVWLDIEQTRIDPKSADYRVTKIIPSLNQDKYLLERIVKNGTQV